MNYKHRDIDLIKLSEEQYLALACDSCGAIGLKENDLVKVPYHITGKYTARVCLMEVLSIGAKPIGLTVNICNEPNPTGEEILNGIRDEISEIGFDMPITISTEKNMETSMTALGVTVIGLIHKNDILVKQVHSEDYVYAIGIPSIGNEVLENQELIANTKLLKKILKEKHINEIIPVGSSGIMGELDIFCKSNDIRIDFQDDLKIDIHKSAGPCTTIIVICKNELEDIFAVPMNLIGRVV